MLQNYTLLKVAIIGIELQNTRNCQRKIKEIRKQKYLLMAVEFWYLFLHLVVSVSQKNRVHTVRSESENDINLNRYKYLMLVIRTRFGVNKAKWSPFQLCETNLKFSINDLAKTYPERRKIRIPHLRNRNRQKNSKTWNVCSFASRHCMSGIFHLKFSCVASNWLIWSQ